MKKLSISSYIFFLLCFLHPCKTEATRYKLYCFYTPQFEQLYKEYFLFSLKDDFYIIAKQFEQEKCSIGEYKTSGWDKIMYHKLEILHKAILEHWNDQIFFYSDIDIIFLKPILNTVLKLLKDRDFLIQQGWPSNKLCAGFIVMKGNTRTLRWIEMALGLMKKGICHDDQTALRIALKNISKEEISWEFLPSLQFPNGKRVLKEDSNHLYTKDTEIHLDPSILLFHANCCIGLENKMHFLNRVQERFKQNISSY